MLAHPTRPLAPLDDAARGAQAHPGADQGQHGHGDEEELEPTFWQGIHGSQKRGRSG